MSLFSAVVSYALPEVEGGPGRLSPMVYRLLPVVGMGLVAACLAVFGPTLEGFAASAFCLALVVVTATDLEYRLIPDRVVGPASLDRSRRDDHRPSEPGLGDLAAAARPGSCSCSA